MGETSKIGIVGAKVPNRLAFRTVDLSLLQTWRDSRDDSLCHLVLQFEDIFKSAVEAVRPEVCAGTCVDQLATDSQSVAAFIGRFVSGGGQLPGAISGRL